jgi:hypothetical protein
MIPRSRASASPPALGALFADLAQRLADEFRPTA